jgi:1-acyl-sn-glycerol-3-phosphate acyltransferase
MPLAPGSRREPAPLPGPPIAGWRRTIRFWISRLLAGLVVRGYLRLRIEGREHVPPTPVLYCANHLDWLDPVILMASLPSRPRFALFGPREEDMDAGGRNRFMGWTGMAVPYKPGKNDLLDTTRRVQAVFDAGWSLGIFGEGRIHRGERELLPLSEGAAYFAMRAKVPIVPVAINGTSSLGFGHRVRVRFGVPLEPGGRPTREAVETLTDRVSDAIRALVADFPDPPPSGRFGRWLTEAFNDWEAAEATPAPIRSARSRDPDSGPAPEAPSSPDAVSGPPAG